MAMMFIELLFAYWLAKDAWLRMKSKVGHVLIRQQ